MLPSIIQAETIVYGGAQLLVKGGSTENIGAGTVVGFGQQINKKLILWGNYEGFKTGEGVGIDNGLIGFTILTENLIHPLRSGLFLTVEGGLGKVEGEKVQFANLTSAGFYFNLSETTKLWIGGNYSSTGESNIYSIQTGLSMFPRWK